MSDKKKSLVVLCLLVFVFCLAIGFAAFSTTLKINGSAKVKPDSSNFSVIFTDQPSNKDPEPDTEISASSVSSSASAGKGIINQLQFDAHDVTFSDNGQVVKYTFYVLNKGKYDAYLTNVNFGNKICENDSSDLALANAACANISIDVKVGEENFADTTVVSNHKLLMGQSEVVVVTFTYAEDGVLPDGDIMVDFDEGLSLVYRTIDESNGEYPKGSQYYECKSLEHKDTYEIGDTVGICNHNNGIVEEFNVIADNGTTVTALAKYNLYVGKIVDGSEAEDEEVIRDIEPDEKGYNLQRDNPAGEGVLYFSETDYWVDENRLPLEKYGTTTINGQNFYNTPLFVYDENSYLYEYVSNYEKLLKEDMDKSSLSATLLNYEQAAGLGCSGWNWTCSSAPSFLMNTNFFLGSARNDDKLWAIYKGGAFFGFTNHVYNCGVRPLITVDKTDLD